MKYFLYFLILSTITLISCTSESKTDFKPRIENGVENTIINEDLTRLIDLFIEENSIRPLENRAVLIIISSPDLDTFTIVIEEALQMVNFWNCHFSTLQKGVLVGVEYSDLSGIVHGDRLSSEHMKYGFPKAYEKFKNNGEFNFVIHENYKPNYWRATFVKSKLLHYKKSTDISEEKEHCYFLE